MSEMVPIEASPACDFAPSPVVIHDCRDLAAE